MSAFDDHICTKLRASSVVKLGPTVVSDAVFWCWQMRCEDCGKIFGYRLPEIIEMTAHSAVPTAWIDGEGYLRCPICKADADWISWPVLTKSWVDEDGSVKHDSIDNGPQCNRCHGKHADGHA